MLCNVNNNPRMLIIYLYINTIRLHIKYNIIKKNVMNSKNNFGVHKIKIENT